MDNNTDAPILALVDQAQRYYTALREKGLPDELAIRMAGDWHQSVLTYTCNTLLQGEIAAKGERFTRRVFRNLEGA